MWPESYQIKKPNQMLMWDLICKRYQKVINFIYGKIWYKSNNMCCTTLRNTRRALTLAVTQGFDIVMSMHGSQLSVYAWWYNTVTLRNESRLFPSNSGNTHWLGFLKTWPPYIHSLVMLETRTRSPGGSLIRAQVLSEFPQAKHKCFFFFNFLRHRPFPL